MSFELTGVADGTEVMPLFARAGAAGAAVSRASETGAVGWAVCALAAGTCFVAVASKLNSGAALPVALSAI